MNAFVTVTATRATETRQFPAFVLRPDESNYSADAIGVQESDGSWTIGVIAVSFDGSGILGIGTVMIDGKAVWFGSFTSIARNVKCSSIDTAITYAEKMLERVYANQDN